jgi:hypothetical protein
MSSSQDSGEEKQDPVQLSVSEDDLDVIVSINAPQEDLQAVADTLLTEAQRLKIEAPLTQDFLLKWLKKTVKEDGLIPNSVLLSGNPPVLPVDGTVEWADDFFNTGFKLDSETGMVDYRQRSGRSSVEKGELLATILPGKPGKNGKTVFGDAIQVSKPKAAKLTAAKNVERKEGDNTFYAAESGRVELVGDRLSVSDQLIISGSVGLESGNITHPGALVVQQDVQEDSVVSATGDVEVQGLIEPATITSEGNIYTRGGITGKEGTTIKAAGEVHAKFILDCNVEAGGDVIVEREIVHSNVKSKGAVRIGQGRIVGGEITALGGIDVGEAGSDACVPTSLIPGVDYMLEALIEHDLAELKKINHQKEEISLKLQPVLPNIKNLPPARKKGVVALLEQAKVLAKTADTIDEKVQQKRDLSKDKADPMITIRKSIFPELKVKIKGEHNKFKQTLQGPLKVECVAAKIRVKSLD